MSEEIIEFCDNKIEKRKTSAPQNPSFRRCAYWQHISILRYFFAWDKLQMLYWLRKLLLQN